MRYLVLAFILIMTAYMVYSLILSEGYAADHCNKPCIEAIVDFNKAVKDLKGVDA